MSQILGKDFKTRVPTFSDDASIQEAFSVYHFGVENYTSQPIPTDSIEGHFSLLNERISVNESSLAGLSQTFISRTSSAENPNRIIPATNSIVPLTILGVQNQIAELQLWLNTETEVAKIHSSGAASFNSYLRVGSVAQSLDVGISINLSNAAHKGIVVRGSGGQTGNLQEWTNNTGTTVLARVDSQGQVYSQDVEVVTLSKTQTLTAKTLNTPTINTATMTNSTINNSTFNGGNIVNAVSITLSGSQSLSSRVRNITASTGNPVGGTDGDIWVKYA
jgi:hypothetical protein